jgi:hypothetical protein
VAQVSSPVLEAGGGDVLQLNCNFSPERFMARKTHSVQPQGAAAIGRAVHAHGAAAAPYKNRALGRVLPADYNLNFG